MDFLRATSRQLDREHRDTLALLGRLERCVLDVPAGGAPDEGFATLARSVCRGASTEIDRHFRFEEEALFPRLADAGEAEMVALLLEEHATIRATTAALLPLLQEAATGPTDAKRFAQMKPVALEFIERLSAHIHMETGGLVPMLDDLLDEATDQELVFAYAND